MWSRGFPWPMLQTPATSRVCICVPAPERGPRKYHCPTSRARKVALDGPEDGSQILKTLKTMFMFRTNKQKQLDHQQFEEGPVQLYLPWWAGILEYIGSQSEPWWPSLKRPCQHGSGKPGTPNQCRLTSLVVLECHDPPKKIWVHPHSVRPVAVSWCEQHRNRSGFWFGLRQVTPKWCLPQRTSKNDTGASLDQRCPNPVFGHLRSGRGGWLASTIEGRAVLNSNCLDEHQLDLS